MAENVLDNEINFNEFLNSLPGRPVESPDYGPNLEVIASDDIIKETNELYTLHLRGELTQMGLNMPNVGPSQVRRSRHYDCLRNLACDFQNSPQRLWVYEQAQNVSLETLNFRTFQDLLSGLFQEGGVTHERILVLFYFCTDLSIRALQETISEYFIRMYSWTLSFFSRKLSYWIEQEGGWGVVLRSSVSYIKELSVLGFCIVGIIAALVFIRNRK